MRTSGIVSHAVLGARRLSTDPRPLTYDPADITITASNGQPVKFTDAPVLVNAAGEKVYPAPVVPFEIPSWVGRVRVNYAGAKALA